jgi:subtilisin family serine protease
MTLPRFLVIAVLSTFTTLTVVTAASDSSGNVQVLVRSKGPLTPDALAAISAIGSKVSYVWPEINSLAMMVSVSKMGNLMNSPYVDLVETDQETTVDSGNNAPSAGATPTLTAVPIFASTTPLQTWNQSMAQTTGSGFDGTGVTVAVVDSGLPQNWPDFLPAGSVDLDHAAGFSAEGKGSFLGTANAKLGVGGAIGLFPHGLAVSSIIVGFPSEFGPVGGAAPGAKILPIRVLTRFNSGWYSWYVAAFMYLADLKASGAIPGPMVINFSIQSRGFNARQVVADAIDYAISKGIVFVTIAGNFGPDPGSISFPGQLPEAITVGATGWVGQFSTPTWSFSPVPPNDPLQVYVPDFSGREFASDPPATRIDVVAPGSFVFGEWLIGPGFSEGREVAFDPVENFIFGTSFACPHVVGIAAQMLSKNPTLNQGQVETILRNTALSIPSSVADPAATGKGLVRGTLAVANTPAP